MSRRQDPRPEPDGEDAGLVERWHRELAELSDGWEERVAELERQRRTTTPAESRPEDDPADSAHDPAPGAADA